MFFGWSEVPDHKQVEKGHFNSNCNNRIEPTKDKVGFKGD